MTNDKKNEKAKTHMHKMQEKKVPTLHETYQETQKHQDNMAMHHVQGKRQTTRSTRRNRKTKSGIK